MRSLITHQALQSSFKRNMFAVVIIVSIFVGMILYDYYSIKPSKRKEVILDEETQRQLYWKNYYETLVRKNDEDILHERERKYFYMLDMWHKMWRVHRYILVFYVTRNLYYDHPCFTLNFPAIKNYCYKNANINEFIPKLLIAETDEDELEIDKEEALHLYQFISANIKDFVF